MTRQLGAALALACVGVMLFAGGTAMAARGLITGFSDGIYVTDDAGARSLWLDRVSQADAGLIRINVPWSLVAPTPPPDPANPASYDLSALDAVVRDARARGLMVMLDVLGAPSWAEGPGRPSSADPGTWKPNPAALAAFTQALARHYLGQVQALQVWNEPDLPEYLTPQFEGGNAVSPEHYRAMLNASYAAIKAVNPGMLVVTGGTAPYGGTTAKGPRVRPVAFERQLLCVRQAKRKKGKRRKKGPRFARLNGCGPAASFDILAHQPINTSGPPTQHAFNPDDASSADLGRIARVLRGAERLGTVSRQRHSIWATEMWWDSNPPNSAGSPPARQARWIEQALYLAWRDGASAVINLLIRDAAGDDHHILDGSGSGIYFANGQPKPSAVAFRFPFVADRLGRGALRAWGKAPATGKLVIQRRGHGRWATIRKLNVHAGAVFTIRLGLKGKQRLRARVAGITSLVWKQA